MGSWLTSGAKRSLLFALERSLPQTKRLALAQRLMDKVNGDNNDDLATNGEKLIVSQFSCAVSRRPAVVFDVGANVGLWTRAFLSQLPCPACTFYCVEPSKRTFQTLQQNLRLCGSRVIPVNCALGDKDETAKLNIYAELAGTNSLIRRHAKTLGEVIGTEDIVVTRGDSFCRERGIDRVDFLKIDTEGNELPVIRGFENMLGEARIDCIQFEYGGTWIDARLFLADAFEMLVALGYVVGKIFPDGVHFLDDYDPALETFQLSNYLAVRPEWVSVFSLPR